MCRERYPHLHYGFPTSLFVHFFHLCPVMHVIMLNFTKPGVQNIAFFLSPTCRVPCMCAILSSRVMALVYRALKVCFLLHQVSDTKVIEERPGQNILQFQSMNVDARDKWHLKSQQLKVPAGSGWHMHVLSGIWVATKFLVSLSLNF